MDPVAWVVFLAAAVLVAAAFVAAGLAVVDLAAAGLLAVLAAVVFAVPTARWVGKKLYAVRPLAPVWDGCYAFGLLMVLLLSTALLVKGSYNPFIYFNF